MIKSKKGKVIVAVGVSILIIAAYVGFTKYYEYYEERHLRRADAHLMVDDRLQAISALKAHVLEHPDSFFPKLRLACLIGMVGDPESALRIVNDAGRRSYTGDITKLSYYGSKGPSAYITEALKVLKENAIEAIELDRKTARSYASLSIELAESHPILTYEGLNSYDSASSYYNLLFSYRDLCEARALSCFVEWLDSKFAVVYNYFRSTIDERVSDLDSLFYSSESDWYYYSELSSLVGGVASKRFSNEDWDGAYKAYEFQRDCYIACIRKDTPDSKKSYYLSFAGEPQYNMAISKYNAGDYVNARNELKKLKNNHRRYVETNDSELRKLEELLN
ncbi:MAG: hypothetical protein IIB00_05740 [candidate division Zixibacteria bacterium]|nr:hypothetical protein [candidate division Zixibacteria bacterium]